MCGTLADDWYPVKLIEFMERALIKDAENVLFIEATVV
jgi:hypothetical protein